MSKKFKIVVTDWEYENLNDELEVLSQLDADIETNHQTRDPKEIIKFAKDADAIITQYPNMPADFLDQLTNCKVISRYGTGIDGVDLKKATEDGIIVSNVFEYCTDEVSAQAQTLLLALARSIPQYSKFIQNGGWYSKEWKFRSMKNEIVGVIAFGKIAREFIKKMIPLAKEIWVYDPFVDNATIEAAGPTVKAKSFDEVVENSDYISLHCPLTKEGESEYPTHYMFNKEVFKRMKKTAILVNCARGGCVNQEDLAWALDIGEIRAAGIDVIESEPPEKGNPLLGRDNLILTNHMAWYSEDSIVSVKRQVAQNVVDVLTGGTPKYENVVNKDVLDKLKK